VYVQNNITHIPRHEGMRICVLDQNMKTACEILLVRGNTIKHIPTFGVSIFCAFPGGDEKHHGEAGGERGSRYLFF
jgi:hypothetical protein